MLRLLVLLCVCLIVTPALARKGGSFRGFGRGAGSVHVPQRATLDAPRTERGFASGSAIPVTLRISRREARPAGRGGLGGPGAPAYASAAGSGSVQAEEPVVRLRCDDGTEVGGFCVLSSPRAR